MINDIDIITNHLFQCVCKRGHIEVAKWLYTLNPAINILNDDHCAFVYACSNYNALNLLKWLYSLPTFKITINQYQKAFFHACTSGGIEIAQWLYNIEPNINIYHNDNYAFIWSTYFQLDVSQWLYTLDPTIIQSIDVMKIFNSACYRGVLHGAKWFYEIVPTIHSQIEMNFHNYPTGLIRNYDMIRWLYTIKPTLQINTLKLSLFNISEESDAYISLLMFKPSSNLVLLKQMRFYILMKLITLDKLPMNVIRTIMNYLFINGFK